MKKRETLTAEELAARLADNPEYQAKLAAQRKRASEIEAEARPMLRDLEFTGIQVRSVEELRHKYSPLPPHAVGVVMHWIGRLSSSSLQEDIVRDLANVQEPFNIRPLLELFEQSSSDSLRWAIANTLAELRPLDARDWVIKVLNEQDFGRAREMLPLALARIAAPSIANPILIQHLDEMPGHVALALAESGGLMEAELLKKKTASERGWVRKELTRAIHKIEKRSST